MFWAASCPSYEEAKRRARTDQSASIFFGRFPIERRRPRPPVVFNNLFEGLIRAKTLGGIDARSAARWNVTGGDRHGYQYASNGGVSGNICRGDTEKKSAD